MLMDTLLSEETHIQQSQTELYKHRRWLEAGNFGFRKLRNCTIHVAKTKALISFAVTAKLICAFVFAYAECWFSHDVAHIKKTFHVHVIFTPLFPTFIFPIYTGVWRGIPIFSLFLLQT